MMILSFFFLSYNYLKKCHILCLWFASFDESWIEAHFSNVISVQHISQKSVQT
jgi:hypothetical protein